MKMGVAAFSGMWIFLHTQNFVATCYPGILVCWNRYRRALSKIVMVLNKIKPANADLPGSIKIVQSSAARWLSFFRRGSTAITRFHS